MKILVLGGTRFWGRELIKNLVDAGHDITVATRGIREIPCFNLVKTLKVERSNLLNIRADYDRSWDIVYDQICYCSKDSQIATEAFSGKIGKLIMASTEAVYPDGYNMVERGFLPFEYPVKMGTRSEFTYAEGKRNAEAYYFQNATFKIVAVRIPFVFGIHDYTGRLKSLIEAVRSGKKIKKPNLNVRISMIESTDIGHIMAKIGSLDITGTINAAPRKPISISRFLESIEKATGKQAMFADRNEQFVNSDFLLDNDRCISTDLLYSYGIEALPIDNWLESLILYNIKNQN